MQVQGTNNDKGNMFSNFLKLIGVCTKMTAIDNDEFTSNADQHRDDLDENRSNDRGTPTQTSPSEQSNPKVKRKKRKKPTLGVPEYSQIEPSSPVKGETAVKKKKKKKGAGLVAEKPSTELSAVSTMKKKKKPSPMGEREDLKEVSAKVGAINPATGKRKKKKRKKQSNDAEVASETNKEHLDPSIDPEQQLKTKKKKKFIQTILEDSGTRTLVESPIQDYIQITQTANFAEGATFQDDPVAPIPKTRSLCGDELETDLQRGLVPDGEQDYHILLQSSHLGAGEPSVVQNKEREFDLNADDEVDFPPKPSFGRASSNLVAETNEYALSLIYGSTDDDSSFLEESFRAMMAPDGEDEGSLAPIKATSREECHTPDPDNIETQAPSRDLLLDPMTEEEIPAMPIFGRASSCLVSVTNQHALALMYGSSEEDDDSDISGEYSVEDQIFDTHRTFTELSKDLDNTAPLAAGGTVITDTSSLSEGDNDNTDDTDQIKDLEDDQADTSLVVEGGIDKIDTFGPVVGASNDNEDSSSAVEGDIDDTDSASSVRGSNGNEQTGPILAAIDQKEDSAFAEMQRKLQELQEKLDQERLKSDILEEALTAYTSKTTDQASQIFVYKGMMKDAQEDYYMVLEKYNEKVGQNAAMLRVVEKMKQRGWQREIVLTEKEKRIEMLEQEVSIHQRTEAEQKLAMLHAKFENERLQDMIDLQKQSLFQVFGGNSLAVF